MMDPAIWQGRRVLITGHTGFKGSWLAWCLARAGAWVVGVALDPPSQPSLFEQARIGEFVDDRRVDVRDAEALAGAVVSARPEIVFHLAAQSLVRRGHDFPIDTWATNTLGTVHLLEAVRRCGTVRVCVVVTTDKVYQGPCDRPFAEGAPLGGADPYSASKAAAEIAVASAREAWATRRRLGLATARAGNTVGGGDYAVDRIVPDCVRAAERGLPLRIRHPGSVRPWSHVTDVLGGYLMLAEKLVVDPVGASGAWNFGPEPREEPTVLELARIVLSGLGREDLLEIHPSPEGPQEVEILRLDPRKAQRELGWRPIFDPRSALHEAARWYAARRDGIDARDCMEATLRLRGIPGGSRLDTRIPPPR